MGRFETTVDFYRCREPYPPVFFEAVAARLQLTKQSRLLDVGCGLGSLAIGFTPFVGSCNAIDPELGMLKAAREAAAEAGLDIAFILARIESLDCGANPFDLVTIGRALHLFPREPTLTVLERIVARHGRIAVCGSIASAAPVNDWTAKFKKVRSAWKSRYGKSPLSHNDNRWFAASKFRKLDETQVTHRHRVSIPHLVERALSFSSTSPAIFGERRPQFEAEIEAAVAPFAIAGFVEEELAVTATIFYAIK
jgi:SAM-dependent methyltransferase